MTPPALMSRNTPFFLSNDLPSSSSFWRRRAPLPCPVFAMPPPRVSSRPRVRCREGWNTPLPLQALTAYVLLYSPLTLVREWEVRGGARTKMLCVGISHASGGPTEESFRRTRRTDGRGRANYLAFQVMRRALTRLSIGARPTSPARDTRDVSPEQRPRARARSARGGGAQGPRSARWRQADEPRGL
jgi:hypothetical protein